MDVLYKTQADLLKGKEKLEQMMQNLEKEKVRDCLGVRLCRPLESYVLDKPRNRVPIGLKST